MTTFKERLEQLADDHDRKSAALRIAAAELHEEQTQTATKSLGRRLNAAIQVRAEARNGNGKNHFINKPERQAIIREFLSDGQTHTISDVMAHLEERHNLRPGRNIVWLDVKRGVGAQSDPSVKYGYRIPINGHARLSTTPPNGHGTRDKNGDQTEGRRKIILALLKRGPQQIKTLMNALHEAGYMIQRDRTRQFIVEHIPEAHCEGVSHNARWMLGKKAKHAKRKKGYSSNVRAQRQRSADLLAKFDTTTPSTPPEAMKAGAVGVYVRRGYLKKKDNGYIRTAKPFSLEMT